MAHAIRTCTCTPRKHAVNHTCACRVRFSVESAFLGTNSGVLGRRHHVPYMAATAGTLKGEIRDRIERTTIASSEKDLLRQW